MREGWSGEVRRRRRMAGGVREGEERERELAELHYYFFLQMPDNLRREVQKRLELLSAGKVSDQIANIA